MHTPSDSVRLGATSRGTLLAVLVALLLAALLIAGGVVMAVSRRPAPQPYLAEIQYGRWETPRRLTVALRLVRSDGQPVVTHRCPDIVILRADGTPFPTDQLTVTYMGPTPDGKRLSIVARDVLPAPDGRPQQVRLRMVAYAPPPWWKQLLFHAKPTDDDPQPPVVLAGSEVNVAAIAPGATQH